jgi:hypothetical protein
VNADGSLGVLAAGVRVELARFYMHQWGFLCGAFYAPRSDPSGQVLLLAFAWLVAYSRLLERRHQVIVEVGCSY